MVFIIIDVLSIRHDSDEKWWGKGIPWNNTIRAPSILPRQIIGRTVITHRDIISRPSKNARLDEIETLLACNIT